MEMAIVAMGCLLLQLGCWNWPREDLILPPLLGTVFGVLESQSGCKEWKTQQYQQVVEKFRGVLHHVAGSQEAESLSLHGWVIQCLKELITGPVLSIFLVLYTSMLSPLRVPRWLQQFPAAHGDMTPSAEGEGHFLLCATFF